ncbi:tartrate-resistant acid phosphatase type 5 [Cyclospora cayetanensis]|uniref:Tartrate-resistant acid phosphatase type 5 n=2 Tax=Cyclospora cayetanensis TaxID=88456 RepID=A0A6P5WDH8_9EIME|nr:tartrate-resistant acid phosphatase type 5 [Cyclospora cayetanensis]OEH75743.1 putative acid phosphatase [Cyclospora cayetanensis]
MARHARTGRGLRARSVAYTAAILVGLLNINSAFGQLKFAALGNYGFDVLGQKQVAETLKKSAADQRISFIVSPGSNFPNGVSGANDTTWEQQFENVYSDEHGALKMPFLTVLGAEDWSGNYTALRDRTNLVYGDGTENETASNAPKWTLPNWWYHYAVHFAASTGSAFISSGHKDMSVGLVFIDTWVLSSSFPFGNVTEKAWTELEATLDIAPKVFDYIIVVGNRPVYSSGSSKGDSMLQYYLEPLLKKAGVDAYISGYDHDMEVIEDGEIAHINCGTGSVAGSSSLVGVSGSKFFSGDRGFCLFELTADGLVTKFIKGETGETLFEHKQPVKSRPERSTIDQFNYLSEMPEVTYYPIPAMGKLPGKDVFVRVVGTIGLCILTFFATLAVASSISKVMK